MKQRVISAIVAIAIVIPVFIFGHLLNGGIWKLGVGLIAALGFKETLNLKESHNKYPKYITLFAFLLLELIVLANNNVGISYGVLALSLLVLLIPTIFDKKYTTKEAFYLIGSVLLIGLFFNLLGQIYIDNKWLVIYLLLEAIITDTFAMLTGMLIGKHKLIPDVSPKKTVEGSVGGSLIGTAVCAIFYYNVIGKMNILLLILMSLILTIVGQLGDLLFSKIKRENGIKDFSNIMPGHGGVLDRLDSTAFILLTYMVIQSLFTLF